MSAEEHLAGPVGLIARSKRLLSGATMYVGAPCFRCGETLRYLVNRACVTCTRRKAQATTSKKRERKRAEGLAALKRLGLR